MGSAPVVEFMCFLPAGWLEKNPKTQPKIKIIDFEAAKGRYLDKIELSMRDDFNRWRVKWNPSESQHPNTDPEDEPDEPSEIVIIGKKIDPTAAAPNISLNSHSYFWRGEIRAIAVVGTILQPGVLTYSGFATYHPSLKFKKDDGPISSYAYPCTAVGTLVLVAGIPICAHVVESSTAEERYEATKERRARLMWLQQAKTVNDQAFDSFAIFAEGDRDVITTSRRAGIRDKTTASPDGDQMGPQRETTGEMGDNPLLALKTVICTAVSLGGFIVQFSGLRGMHWSTSVVQLGAVLVMTAFRAWVRRGLARPPRCQRLSAQFELEWFATTLGDVPSAPWVATSDSNEKDGMASGSEGGLMKAWTIVTSGSYARHKEFSEKTETDFETTDGGLKTMKGDLKTTKGDLRTTEEGLKTAKGDLKPTKGDLKTTGSAESKYGFQTIRLLVEHGANVEARDGQGMTPLDYANRKEREANAKLLRCSSTTALSPS